MSLVKSIFPALPLPASQHHSYRSFLGLTCLMQISTRTEDFIIDTLELRSDMYILNESLTDPAIVKVSQPFPALASACKIRVLFSLLFSLFQHRPRKVEEIFVEVPAVAQG